MEHGLTTQSNTKQNNARFIQPTGRRIQPPAKFRLRLPFPIPIPTPTPTWNSNWFHGFLTQLADRDSTIAMAMVRRGTAVAMAVAMAMTMVRRGYGYDHGHGHGHRYRYRYGSAGWIWPENPPTGARPMDHGNRAKHRVLSR